VGKFSLAAAVEILVYLLLTSKACLEFGKIVGVSEMNVEDTTPKICFTGSLFFCVLCCGASFTKCFALPLCEII
jgi:hypothetical protein